jgi:hypothetical protein
LLLYSSYLPLGVPNWTVIYIINTTTSTDLIASADDMAMAKAYVVGMAMPQDAEWEEGNNDDIETLFGDDDNVDLPVTFDKQAALFASTRPPSARRRPASSWRPSGRPLRPCSWCKQWRWDARRRVQQRRRHLRRQHSEEVMNEEAMEAAAQAEMARDRAF